MAFFIRLLFMYIEKFKIDVRGGSVLALTTARCMLFLWYFVYCLNKKEHISIKTSIKVYKYINIKQIVSIKADLLVRINLQST